MRDRVQYFSNYDMSISYYLQNAENTISKFHAGWRPDEINDVIELYNIWLFVDNGISIKSWAEETKQEILGYKEIVVSYFNRLDRQSWPEVYRQITFEYRHCFWEIIDRFNISGLINSDTLNDALSEKAYDLRDVLHRERLVKKYDKILAELVRRNEHTPEWLLSEFVEENELGRHETIFFPASFTLKDREKAILDYLDLPEPNLNYVRLALEAKKDQNLKLSDEVVLKAKRVERELNDRYFDSENSVHFKYTVWISSEANKPLKWVEQDEEGNPIACYSKEILLQFKGAELLHYCVFGFEFLKGTGLISLVSKASETGTLERMIGMTGRYSYPVTMAFRYNAYISLLQI